MKFKLKLISALLLSPFFLTACLEDKGTTEEQSSGVPNPNLNDGSNFIVEQPQSGDGGALTPIEETPVAGGDDDISNSIQISKGLIINGGAKLVGSRDLKIVFDPPFDSALYKLTNNDSCLGGSWQSYVDSTQVQAPASGPQSYSVAFRDYDGRTTFCFKASTNIDDVAPQIIFGSYPLASVQEGSSVEITFNVVDDLAGVESVSCEISGVVKACLPGQNKISIPQVASGDYSLLVKAEDKLGNRSQASVNFSVTTVYRNLTQNVQVKDYRKVDILFVIDNSGSMAYEQKNMADRVKNFLDVVKGLDWQIGITTTDSRSGAVGGDGRLLELTGKADSYFLNSSMDEALSRTLLGNTLQRSETGHRDEQGIRAAYRAFERAVNKQGVNKNLIRENAHLAVVLISDEDESANTDKNDPQKLVDYVNQSFGGQKAFSYHSIITRPDDSVCLKGQGESYGFRYEAMSKLTGGVIGDVCASDYASQLAGIGEGVRNSLKSITLNCTPVVAGELNQSIKVLKDGQIYADAFTVSGLNLNFSQELAPGDYKIQYTCLK